MNTTRTGPGRREARERAIELIFEADAKSCDVGRLLADLQVPPVPYAAEVVAGIGEQWDTLDALIDDHADGWTVARMPAVDRAVLRLATYELAFRSDVPSAVVLDEAVELAKEYSTENSGRFVNGVLAAICDHVRPPSVEDD